MIFAKNSFINPQYYRIPFKFNYKKGDWYDDQPPFGVPSPPSIPSGNGRKGLN
jgi:hypothetical protein